MTQVSFATEGRGSQKGGNSSSGENKVYNRSKD